MASDPHLLSSDANESCLRLKKHLCTGTQIFDVMVFSELLMHIGDFRAFHVIPEIFIGVED